MVDMWQAIRPFYDDAVNGAPIEVRASCGFNERVDRPGQDPTESEVYWAARGRVTPVWQSIDGQAAFGLAGDLEAPQINPAFLTPMRIELLWVQARGRVSLS
jgi:hypothetical protein